MTYEEYAAAALDSPVCVETYVQATQSWWDNKIVVYAQSPDGAYFIYNMACSQEDASRLVPGTKIRVNGFKSEWAGEVEIVDAAFEFVKGGQPFIAEAEDVTDLIGKAELAGRMNRKIVIRGATVLPQDDGQAFNYKNAENKTDDLYLKVSVNGTAVNAAVEFYLCDADTDVYKAVENLKVGDIIDLEGYLYWYEGPNPHVTAVTRAG